MLNLYPAQTLFIRNARRRIGYCKALLLSAILLFCCRDALAQPHPTVTIDNVPEPVADNIRQHLSLSDEQCQISARRRQTLTSTAADKVRTAMQALGYYQATWEIQPLTTDSCWGLAINVEPGPPVMLDQVEVSLSGEAETDTRFIRLIERMSPQMGEQLNHGRYDSLKTALLKLAQQRGYAEAQFTRQQLLINVAESQADIFLSFSSGPRYRFGPLQLDQNIFDEAFLKRFVPFENDTPFNASLLGQFQQVLINTRYFDQVSVTPLTPDSTAKLIPVRVVLTPGARYSTSLGIGIATDTGPRTSVAFRNNRANQQGHRYGADAQLSSLLYNVNMDYQIPLDKPASELLTLKGGWEKEDTDSAKSETWVAGISHTKTQKNQWIRSLDLVYQVESFEVADEEHDSELIIPGIGWQRSWMDNPVHPNRGWRLQFSLRGAEESLGSDISFLQLRGAGKYIYPLMGGRLLGRLDAGSSAVNHFEEMPATLRFFAGGDNSVRGYDYEELGPTNNAGEVLGGRHLLATSLEYDYPIYKDYSLAVFYDAGNAFDTGNFTLKSSMGVGVRWRSPLGPIRVDIAFPEDSDETFRLHLSMGPDL
ncbi:autotransporter assembly complex protein TamA [Porticoccus sp.]